MSVEVYLEPAEDGHCLAHLLDPPGCAVRAVRRGAAEQEGVFQPAHWTSDPEGLWTAPKVLCRFLEHEREHTGQVPAFLGAWAQIRPGSTRR